MRIAPVYLILLVACESSIETQDGGAGNGGAAGGGSGDVPRPESCDEFCAYIQSLGCGCSCNGVAVPEACLDSAKEVWSCFVDNYRPKEPDGEGCGAPECADLVAEESECEQMQ